MRRPVAALFLSILLVAKTGHAQPKATPVTPTQDIPAPPDVDDPMLRPAPRARIEISTWDDALTYLRARSTDLRIALDEVTRAEAQSRAALAGALPQINGQATFTHNIITNESSQISGLAANGAPIFTDVKTPYPNYLTGSIALTQSILALRTWNSIGTARVALDAAKDSVSDVKRQIALSVANAIVGVVTAERVCELNRVGLLNALQRLELTVRKEALGGASGIDVVRARQDAETARSTLVAGDESLRQSRESLGLALGVPDEIGVAPNVDIRGLEQGTHAVCKPASSVDERPDILALRTRVEVAHRNVNDAKYQYAPTLTLQSQLGTTTIDTGIAPNTTWNVQAVLNVPIWDGGARYGNVRDAKAQELEAFERLTSQRRQATVEVTRARRAVMVTEERRAVAESTRDLAIENDRLTRLAYQEGRGTSLELVATAQALREAEIQLALREFETVNARVSALLTLATCPW